jgi:hypothetical protein
MQDSFVHVAACPAGLPVRLSDRLYTQMPFLRRPWEYTNIDGTHRSGRREEEEVCFSYKGGGGRQISENAGLDRWIGGGMAF